MARMNSLVPPLLAMLVALPAPAASQEDAPGSRDHPLVRRLPGASILSLREADLDEADLAVGGRECRHVEGATYLAVVLYPERSSCLQVIRFHEANLRGTALALTTGKTLPDGCNPWDINGSGVERWLSAVVRGPAGGKSYVFVGCTEGAYETPAGPVLVVDTAEPVEAPAAARAERVPPAAPALGSPAAVVAGPSPEQRPPPLDRAPVAPGPGRLAPAVPVDRAPDVPLATQPAYLSRPEKLRLLQESGQIAPTTELPWSSSQVVSPKHPVARYVSWDPEYPRLQSPVSSAPDGFAWFMNQLPLPRLPEFQPGVIIHIVRPTGGYLGDHLLDCVVADPGAIYTASVSWWVPYDNQRYDPGAGQAQVQSAPQLHVFQNTNHLLVFVPDNDQAYSAEIRVTGRASRGSWYIHGCAIDAFLDRVAYSAPRGSGSAPPSGAGAPSPTPPRPPAAPAASTVRDAARLLSAADRLRLLRDAGIQGTPRPVPGQLRRVDFDRPGDESLSLSFGSSRNVVYWGAATSLQGQFLPYPDYFDAARRPPASAYDPNVLSYLQLSFRAARGQKFLIQCAAPGARLRAVVESTRQRQTSDHVVALFHEALSDRLENVLITGEDLAGWGGSWTMQGCELTEVR